MNMAGMIEYTDDKRLRDSLNISVTVNFLVQPDD